MSVSHLKKGDIICIASGVFEAYERQGPFLVEREFDLIAFVDDVKAQTPVETSWQASDLMGEIPLKLIEKGLVSRVPCRTVHLGSFGEWDVKDERDH
ncbi:hypothetical protein [Pseudomonas abietaniphila]|uniref:hypothetical protein n=1 Tax=Pseudomonas abietaniphila TaxID=89065 RepID=UPI000781E371|nr:hypothetical protein [Pseudomonas abietaniphila]